MTDSRKYPSAPFDPEKDAAIRAANERREKTIAYQAEDAAPISRRWTIPGIQAVDTIHDWAGKRGFTETRTPDTSEFKIGTGTSEVPQTPKV